MGVANNYYTCCCKLYRLVPVLLHQFSNLMQLVCVLFTPFQLFTFLIVGENFYNYGLVILYTAAVQCYKY